MEADDSKVLVRIYPGEPELYSRETMNLSPLWRNQMLKSGKVYLEDHSRDHLKPLLDILETSLSPRLDVLPSDELSSNDWQDIREAAYDHDVLKYWQTCVRAALYASRPRLPLHRELQIGLAIEDHKIIVQATWEVSSDVLFRMKTLEIETIGLESWNRLREVVEGLGLDSYTTAVGPKLQEWINKGKEAKLDSGKNVLDTLFTEAPSWKRSSHY